MGHPKQIPLTPQTDEQNFPVWQFNAPPGQSGHGYPRMLTRPATKQDREEFRERHMRIDTRTREEYWEGRPPKVGDPIPITSILEMVDSGHALTVGEPIILHDPHEEREILELFGAQLGLGALEPLPAAGTVSVHMGQRLADMVVPHVDPEIEKLKRENEALKLQLEQIDLRRKLQEQGIDPDGPQPKRRGRQPRAQTEEQTSVEDAGEDLLPGAMGNPND